MSEPGRRGRTDLPRPPRRDCLLLPAGCGLAMPAFVHHLRVRYNECDAQGHVFNANYFVYFDVALTELWREALGSYTALAADGLDLVVAETGARFCAPVRFDDELEITLEIKHLGNTSMVSTIGIVREGNTLADGRIVHIFVHADCLGKKAPIPDHVRRALQCYGADDLDTLTMSPATEGRCPDH